MLISSGCFRICVGFWPANLALFVNCVNIDQVNVDSVNQVIHRYESWRPLNMSASDSESLRQLTARQAAARLGVKVQTIYAYVSRGVLERVPSEDGRQSLFDARQVERLAGKRRGGAKTGGLTVVLGTGLTLIEPERVSYRGINTASLARTTPFEAVAQWLWLGEARPNSAGTSPEHWRPWSASPDALAVARDIQQSLPEGTGTADLLRAITSAVGPTDPLRFDLAANAVAACGRRLIAAMVDGLPRLSAEPEGDLNLAGAVAISKSIASRLWQRLTDQTASSGDLVALNAALVLTADHGLAASTLAARVAASVRADPVSVVATGLGTLSGPLHGAASAPVHRLFSEVERPERAMAVLGEFMRQHSRVPGFGHLIYKDWDPRAVVLLDLIRANGGSPRRLDVVERLLELILERTSVRPNIDFTLGALTYISGMGERAGETLFGVARSAGWIAHALEEYMEPALRFRPRDHYTGVGVAD
jgi:citrate synthase